MRLTLCELSGGRAGGMLVPAWRRCLSWLPWSLHHLADQTLEDQTLEGSQASTLVSLDGKARYHQSA